MSRLPHTPEERAANRKWIWKAWLLTVLPPDEMSRQLLAPMPPTIGELMVFARLWAEKHARKCQHCGKPLPIELRARPKKRKKLKPSTA